MADEDDEAPAVETEDSSAEVPEPQEPESQEPVPQAAEPQTPRAGESHDTSDAVYDIPVEITAVLGTATLQVSQLLKLGRGAVVELDRKVDEEIEIHANNRLVARGEVMVINDRLAVTMTDIIKTSSRR
jgi:flagellar motor switch protein FliN/FliY